MSHFEARPIDCICLMFEQPKPLEGPKDLSLHCKGSGVPWLVQQSIDGDRAQTRQALTRLPVVCGDRQGPENDARIALRPSIEQPPAEVSEIEMPERDMEQQCRQCLPVRCLDHSPPRRRGPQIAF